VEAVFLCEDPDTIRFPTVRLLFLPPGFTVPVRATPRPSSVSGRVEIAERLEFEQQNYPAALAGYEQALEHATDLETRAELTNAIARVQKKSARYPDAITSYLRITRDFGQVRSASGIPLGLAARMELASLYLATRDPLRSLQTSIDLYESLVKGIWTLEESQYDLFAQTVSDGIDRLLSQLRPDSQSLSHERRFAQLKEEEKKRRESATRLLPFSASAARSIETRLSGSAGAGSFERFELELGGASYPVSVRSEKTGSATAATKIWGLLLDPESLKEALHQLLRTHASAEDAAWVVRGTDGKVMMASARTPSGPFTIRAGFEGDFPNWSVEFYQLSPHRLTTLLGSRQGIYFYMFLLIAGMLVFGLILTVRTVSHELELARMKSDFVSTVSHEFKSPLTSIQQVAEMLQAGRVPSEDRRRQYYDLLLEQSQRLCLLTDNILNLARIEEGRKKFALEKLDVTRLLKEVLPAVQDRVRHEGFAIELKVEEPLPEISADGEALAQAVTNLLDNAVKYSGQSRSIVVRSFVHGQHLVISVRDFGIGIRKDQADRVFDRFYRGGDELTRSVKGSGLGLTLVKEIVEAHHGTVRVESEPGRGSTFSIVLPLGQTEAPGHGKNPDHRR
jgi:signal transduction histidine kinase